MDVMEVCETWLARDFLRTAGRPIDIPPCGCSTTDCPPIAQPKEHHMTTTPGLPRHITLAQQQAAVEALGLNWGGRLVEIRMTVVDVEIVSEAVIDGKNRIDDHGRMCLVIDRIPIAN